MKHQNPLNLPVNTEPESDGDFSAEYIIQKTKKEDEKCQEYSEP
jgi:hypothetical protein